MCSWMVVVNCPSRSSLYLSLALCVDHLSIIPTEYSDVLRWWWRAPLCRCAPNLVASYKSLHSVDSPAHPPPHCSPTFCQNSEAQKPETYRVATFNAHKLSKQNARSRFHRKDLDSFEIAREIGDHLEISGQF